jgi:hypothetical protein
VTTAPTVGPHTLMRTHRVMDDERAPARALAAIGCASLCVVVAQWRARRTGPFKAAAAATWLTLGPAAVLMASQGKGDLERTLRAHGRGIGSGNEREAREIGAAGAEAVRTIMRSASKD